LWNEIHALIIEFLKFVGVGNLKVISVGCSGCKIPVGTVVKEADILG